MRAKATATFVKPNKQQTSSITTTKTTTTTTTNKSKAPTVNVKFTTNKTAAATKTVTTNKPKKTTATKTTTKSSGSTKVHFKKPDIKLNLLCSNVVNDFKKLHWNKWRIALSVLILLIWILHTACTAGPVWLTFNGVQTQGIWRTCYEKNVNDGLSCERYAKLLYADDFKWIQSFMSVALAVNFINILYFAFVLRLQWPSTPLIVSVIFAALLTILALIFYTACYIAPVQNSSLMFGWSYFIGWVTIAVSIVAVIILFKESTINI